MAEHKPLKDFAGNTLAEGDVVGYADGKYSTLHIGRVLRFTPKTIELAPITSYTLHPMYRPGWTRKTPDQVSLLSRELHGLEDSEIWLHFDRLAKAE